MHQRFLTAALIATACAPLLATAQDDARLQKTSVRPLSTIAPQQALSTLERGRIARELTLRFAPDVQAAGQDVVGWGRKLGRLIGAADALNVQNAAKMPTLNTAMAVLIGQPIQSSSIQSALKEIESGVIGPATLGDPRGDTVYTPLEKGRCRVADSRVINSPLPGGVARQIRVETISSYASQGGSGSSGGDGSQNCGIPTGTTALAISVTVLSNGQEGIFKIYPDGTNYTQGNTIYYTSTVSAANDVIVKSCLTCDLELQIYSSSNVHYVLDVMGYFMRPTVTALECVPSASQTVSLPVSGSTGKAISPACAAGFARTRTNCSTGTYNTFLTESGSGVCSAKNTGTTASQVTASSVCCRIPGR